jgi:hypothetical protein
MVVQKPTVAPCVIAKAERGQHDRPRLPDLCRTVERDNKRVLRRDEFVASRNVGNQQKLLFLTM